MRRCWFGCMVMCAVMVACSRTPAPEAAKPVTAARPAIAAQGATAATVRPAAASVSKESQNAPPFPTASMPADAPRIETSDDSEGPFHIDGQSFTFVRHVQKIAGSKSPDDSTVEWWELRDGSGTAVYHENYSITFQDGRFEDTEDVDARELETKLGQGIIVSGMSLPSAPDTGSWVRVFGMLNGKLVPFGGPISIYGEFLREGIDTIQPSPIFKGQQQQLVSRDVLNFRMWTGNFNIIYAVAIDWIQGTLRPAWTCMQSTSQGPSSACRYKVKADAAARTELSFVRLFSEPDAGFTPKHVVIKPESKIEFVEAQMPVAWHSDPSGISFGVPVSNSSSPTDTIWLHIKVDGQDGWISGEEDFQAVGLPEAG